MYRKVKFYDIRVCVLTQGGSQEFPRPLCNSNPKVHYRRRILSKAFHPLFMSGLL
jgi:hypothetical protein